MTGAASLRTHSAEQTRRLGQLLAGRLRGGDVVVLDGPLGSGKTTLVQGLAAGLGVPGPVTSPTFVLARVQASQRPGSPGLVHVDAYRIGSALELDDLDLDSDLEDAVVAVEWGGGLADRLSPDRVEIRLARPLGTGDAGAHDDGLDAPDEVAAAVAGAGAGAGEPRLVEIQAVGPRWREVDLARALAGELSGEGARELPSEVEAPGPGGLAAAC